MAQEGHKISIIAAIGTNRALGKDNQLLWRLPNDLKHFKELTSGHPVIMGRKTFESIGRALPNRTNVVVTRYRDYPVPEGVLIATTLPEALSVAKDAAGAEEIFVIGGGQLYEAALPFAARLYLTLVQDAPEADTFFPVYENQFSREISKESHEENGIQYACVTLER